MSFSGFRPRWLTERPLYPRDPSDKVVADGLEQAFDMRLGGGLLRSSDPRVNSPKFGCLFEGFRDEDLATVDHDTPHVDDGLVFECPVEIDLGG